MGRTMTFQPSQVRNVKKNSRGNVSMFLESGGGILGIGTPELITILLVGYFVLGPNELFKLTKEIGKFIQNFRTLGAEATKSFESTMENQLELDELRKAQSELTKAFDFRRSINVDSESEAFSELPPIATEAVAAAAAATTGAAKGAATTTSNGDTGVEPTKKKKKRRRVKKKKEVEMDGSGDIPDLDMSAAFKDDFQEGMGIGAKPPTPAPSETDATEAEMAAKLRKERIERLESAQARSETEAQPLPNPSKGGEDWYAQSESDIASEVLAQQQSPEEVAAAQDRFQAQVSGQWNNQVIENEDKLSPLAKIMEQIAILEDEKIATNMRLDDEFSRRTEVEQKFYEEKRTLLEQAAAEVSAAAYSNFDFDGDDSVSVSVTTETKTTSVNDTKKEEVINNATVAEK